MDGFGNPLFSSTCSENNSTSEKINCEARLEPPVLIPNPEDYLVSANFLVNQGGTDPNLNGGDGCELTNLPLPPVAGPNLFSSNPTVLAPFSSMDDNWLFSGSHQLNELPTSQAHETLISATKYAGFDRMFLPRFRARRGQATDPHSLAERHRREKISDRIKDLHDLIPNSNKTDKASMLDDIINYIKFLQLKIKDPNGISSSASVGSSASVSPEGTTELEHKRKALCLMPTELASVISTQKGKNTAVMPTARQNFDPVLNIASFLSNDGRGK